MPRHRRRRLKNQRQKIEQFGGLSLTRAKFYIKLHAYTRAFVAPVVALVLFVGAASAGLLTPYFPWAQGLGLGLLALWFFFQMIKTQQRFHKQSTQGHKTELLTWMRREDRWRRLVLQTRLMPRRLWRRRKKLGAVAGGGLLVLAFLAWMEWGGAVLATVNPSLAQYWRETPPDLSAWITPPDYVKAPPMMIATPAEAPKDSKLLTVPEGSQLDLRLSGGGRRPVALVNGVSVPLKRDEQGDYVLSERLTKGDALALSRGWKSLGYWRIKIVADQAPQVAFAAKPTVSAHQTVQIAVEASDDYAVSRAQLLVTEVPNVAGASATPHEPLSLPLLVPTAAKIDETFFPDLTAAPFAGRPVTLQLRVEDVSGRVGYSAKIPFVLPERSFRHPLAQALVEERNRLESQDDTRSRAEIANIMAGIAHQPEAFRKDPVVMMALRSGAVRLMLDESNEVRGIVSKLLWQIALRIEDGDVGLAREALRSAQSDLAAALDMRADRSVTEEKVRQLDLKMALYLAAAAERMSKAQSPAQKAAGQTPLQNVELPLFSLKDKAISIADLQRQLQEVKDAFARNDEADLRIRLVRLQTVCENLKLTVLPLTEGQKRQMQIYTALKSVDASQQKLMDDTRRTARFGRNKDVANQLSDKQARLYKKLAALLQKMPQSPPRLHAAAAAMDSAAAALKAEDLIGAANQQQAALGHLRLGMVALLQGFPQATASLPDGRADVPEAGMTPLRQRNEEIKLIPFNLDVDKVRMLLKDSRRSGR